MNIYGIVCEYNPFHNGHLYQLEEIKSRGADAIICVMSGNFVQRGDLAIMQKHARAEVAVRCGADIVLELPLPYALSSAERFAFGAVSILENLGVVSYLAFGAETDNINELIRAATLLGSGELDSAITEELSKGVSYAAARESALYKKDKTLAELIKTPNNILAVEYLKALFLLKSDISPVAIKRVGTAHDAETSSGAFSSASHIRELILKNENVNDLLPVSCAEILNREASLGHAPVNISNASISILSTLKRLSPEDFKRYSDVSEGLENRLFDAVSASTSLEEAISIAKTKRYTHSRIRRILINAFLDIKSELVTAPPPYVKLLAFSDAGRAILKQIKTSSEIPVITKPASIKNESEPAKSLLALEKRADDIYSLFMKKPVEQGGALKKSPVFISYK